MLERTYLFYGNVRLRYIKCEAAQFLRTIYKLAMMRSPRFQCFLLNFRLVGAVFVIFGLYLVLWGKGKEAERARITNEVEADSHELLK